MPVYRYTATATAGAASRGEITADSPQQVRAALRRMGLVPLRITEARPPKARPALARGDLDGLRRGRRRAMLIELYENLGALVATGTRLAPALDILAGARSGRGERRLATLCRQLAERVRHGASLAEAMRERADWFGPVDAALVAAAERSGDLEGALAELAAHHGRAGELRGRLAMTMAYPALLALVGTGVVVFLATTTVPQLAGALRDAGAELPRSTAALAGAGRFLAAHPVPVVLIGTVGLGGLAWLLVTPRVARARLRLPLAGRTIARADLAGVCLLLARLLRSGVPLDEALGLAAPAARNAAIRSAVARLGRDLRSGRTAAELLEDSGLFEPVFCRVVEVGEESGELPQVLETLGERFRISSHRLVDRLAAALEPAMILVLAVAVGFVVYAAVAPMLRLAQTIG